MTFTLFGFRFFITRVDDKRLDQVRDYLAQHRRIKAYRVYKEMFPDSTFSDFVKRFPRSQS